MRRLLCLVTWVGLVGAASLSKASIATFDITDPNPLYAGTEMFPEGYGLSAMTDYGDRVTSTSMSHGTSTYGYGVGAEGFTPNVTMDFGPFSLLSGGPELWRYDYGDLTRVMYQGSRGSVGTNYNVLQIVIKADPFYDAILYGFDLGGWNQTDYQIDAVVVYDGIPFPFLTPTNDIYKATIVNVNGSGPSHTTFDCGAGLRAHEIWITIDANNLGDVSEYIGIDNIRFGQVERTDGTSGEAPEASSILIWGGIAACSAIYARRRRSR